MGALSGAGGQKHLQLGLGEHRRADVAAFHHVIARTADALLLGHKRLANGGRGGHGADGTVYLRRADGVGHVHAGNGDAARQRIARLMGEPDLVHVGDAAERFAVFQRNAVLQRLPGDGAVHGARIQAREAQTARDRLRNGRFAGAARAVDSDDHRASLSISSKKPG